VFYQKTGLDLSLIVEKILIGNDRTSYVQAQSGLTIALHRSGISHHSIIICKTDRDYVRQAKTLHAYLQEEVNKNSVATFRDRISQSR
jgi:hypothetical protein